MCFSLATEYHCNQEHGAYADQIISQFITKMTSTQASFRSSHRTAFARLSFSGGLHNMSETSQTCLMSSAHVHYNATVGQLNVSVISPDSYFYRCTSCFTNRSLYVFTARCFSSLESMYNNQVQQKNLTYTNRE